MTRKEEILNATLELAAEQGLESVTLAQIAKRVGIRTPSLYNHYSSKEELVAALYASIRERAKQLGNPASLDVAALAQDRSLEEALLLSLEGYLLLITDRRMLQLLKVLYSARATSPEAAHILLEEVDRMVRAAQTLFYALVVHGKMRNEDIDTAALSYAMTMHAMLDHEMDRISAGEMPGTQTPTVTDEMRRYIRWFSAVMCVGEEDRHA